MEFRLETLLNFLSIFLAVVAFLVWYCQVTMGMCTKRGKNLSGKVAIITGGNSGLGLALATELSLLKCRVYLACRSVAPNEPNPYETVSQLRESTNNDQVFHLALDLSSMQAVRNAVKAFAKMEDKLDILVNNAGTDRKFFFFIPK